MSEVPPYGLRFHVLILGILIWEFGICFLGSGIWDCRLGSWDLNLALVLLTWEGGCRIQGFIVSSFVSEGGVMVLALKVQCAEFTYQG